MGSEVTQAEYRLGREPGNKAKTYPAEILTPEEVCALLARCSVTSSYGIRHRALITLSYHTGLRISEALALRVKDIDTEIWSVTVPHGQGGPAPNRRHRPGCERVDRGVDRTAKQVRFPCRGAVVLHAERHLDRYFTDPGSSASACPPGRDR